MEKIVLNYDVYSKSCLDFSLFFMENHWNFYCFQIATPHFVIWNLCMHQNDTKSIVDPF
eukprot:TRINITY_DN3912_c0_g1_i1.p1 TRINITY_DN3912_c0_g1~~TRINITY_DN3912_c0_g1_i1.p1  ORF type:complete len:59 (+),score=8.79 TRINITY_DN3912_c0_g1_i1:124-300(+)